MALLLSTITALVSLSGGEDTGYAWRGVGGTSRFDSPRRRGARLFLFHAQGGICPDCGLSLEEATDRYGKPTRVEFCHVVSRGLAARTSDEGLGWTPGNLFLGHRVCPKVPGESAPRGNKEQQSRGPVVLPEHLRRPDVIAEPADWPEAPALRRMS